MSFYQLPEEVIEVIFQFLDGASFCVSEAVCKSWHKLLVRMQNKEKRWLTFCLKEIPTDVIEDMLANKEIPLENQIIDWKSLYKKWYRGKFMKRNKVSIGSVQAFCENPVTCMKSSGSYILTGHSNGILCLWSLFTRKLVRRTLCHLRTVTDLALVDLENLGEYHGFETEAFAHHHIITISKDSCIKIKSLLESIINEEKDIVLNQHSDDLSSVKVFGNYFAVSCRDNTVSLWSLSIQKIPEYLLKVSLLKAIIGPEDNLWNAGFWNGKVYCVSHSKRLRVYNKITNEWPEHTPFKKCLDSAQEKRLCITAYYLFRNRIIIMCTASGKLIVSIDDDNYKVYNLMETLRTLIVSVVLQGTTLALGGENGRLYVFYVPTAKSLLDLDFIHPTFVHTLSEASIVSMDIAYRHESPVVLASTTETLYIVNWFGKEVEIKRSDARCYFDSRILIE